MAVGLIILFVILGILLIFGIWAWTLYNKFIALKNEVEEAFSTMDVYLKKRYDLIPNVVATVKGYAKHEQETLKNVIALRNSAMGANSLEEKQAKEGQLSGALKSLFAVAEQYPELKANTNFLQLQAQLQSIEEGIAESRKYYNAVVKSFNYKLQAFPSNIIGRMMKLTKQPMFVVDNVQERQNVKVEF